MHSVRNCIEWMIANGTKAPDNEYHLEVEQNVTVCYRRGFDHTTHFSFIINFGDSAIILPITADDFRDSVRAYCEDLMTEDSNNKGEIHHV